MAPRSGTTRLTFFAQYSLSVRIVWLMIVSRSRPPPRGPLRISGETRAATSSKYAQQAWSRVSLRSSSAASIGSGSRELAENEIPQKSGRSGADLIFDDIERPSVVEGSPEVGPDGDRPITLAVRRERLERVIGGFRPAAPARPIDRERHGFLRLRAPLEHHADRHDGPPRPGYGMPFGRPAHGEVAAQRRRPQERHVPGARAYLSAGLPGAQWWVAGRAVDRAEDADVELTEVERLYTEHGLWDSAFSQ